MQLWRAGSFSLAFSPRTRVLASIIPSWFISENQCLRIPVSSVISFTILIIRNRRASLPGPRALALFRIKKIGILLAALFAFIKFTASGCSEFVIPSGLRSLLIVYLCAPTQIAAKDISIWTSLDMARDWTMPDQPSPPKPAPPTPTPPPEPLPPNPPPVPPVGR